MAFCRAMQLMSVTLIAAALWSSTTAVVIKDDYVAPQPQWQDFPKERHPGAWAACEPAVCHQVQTQSEGLEKIKTLKNFVRETLYLLDELVTTLDKELVEAGSALRQFVGPRCPTSHSILDKVAKSDKEKDVLNLYARDGQVHGDLEVATTDSGDRELSQEQNQLSQEQNQLSQEQGEQHLQQEHKDYQQQRQHYQEQEQHQQQLHKGHEHSVEHGSTTSSLGYSESASRGSSSSSNYQPSSHSTSAGSGKSVSSHKTHSSTHHGSSSGQTSVGGAGDGTISQRSRSEAQIGKQSGCRGVMKGESPYWVPGLDKWCEQNCSQGYCPQTHCVCGTH